MATSNQLKLSNSTSPMSGKLPRDRAQSSTSRFGKSYCVVIVALLAILIAVYFGISHSNGDDHCVITAVSTLPDKTVTKSPVSILQEYCQQNKLKDSDCEFTEVPVHSGGGFSYVVTVKGNSYNGTVRTKKQEAKHSAAEVAVQQLGLSKNVT